MEYRITIRNREGVTVFEWPAVVDSFAVKLDDIEGLIGSVVEDFYGWAVTFERWSLCMDERVSETYTWDGRHWLVPDEMGER